MILAQLRDIASWSLYQWSLGIVIIACTVAILWAIMVALEVKPSPFAMKILRILGIGLVGLIALTILWSFWR